MGLQSEQGAGHAVSCARCKVQGAGCRVQETGCGARVRGAGWRRPTTCKGAGSRVGRWFGFALCESQVIGMRVA
jgi:hypothetical protein